MKLKNKGCGFLFAGNILSQPAYKNIEYNQTGELTNTNEIVKDLFWIGIHPGIDKQVIDYVVGKFEDYIKKI